jgi:hypothetical protein
MLANLQMTIASKSKDLSALQSRVVEIDSERAADVSAPLLWRM